MSVPLHMGIGNKYLTARHIDTCLEGQTSTGDLSNGRQPWETLTCYYISLRAQQGFGVGNHASGFIYIPKYKPKLT